MPDRVSESRKPSAKRKEGATIGLSAVNMHPAHETVLSMDRLYKELFGNEYPPPERKS